VLKEWDVWNGEKPAQKSMPKGKGSKEGRTEEKNRKSKKIKVHIHGRKNRPLKS
jgi:hypothetical protein